MPSHKNPNGFSRGSVNKTISILLALLLLLALNGCVRTTENGKHFGQVTAIEDNGIWWKTTSVYVKTDISSSQEDIYCLDKTKENYEVLKSNLENLARNREKITLTFYDELLIGWWRCNGEIGIIDGISE